MPLRIPSFAASEFSASLSGLRRHSWVDTNRSAPCTIPSSPVRARIANWPSAALNACASSAVSLMSATTSPCRLTVELSGASRRTGLALYLSRVRSNDLLGLRLARTKISFSCTSVIPLHEPLHSHNPGPDTDEQPDDTRDKTD